MWRTARSALAALLLVPLLHSLPRCHASSPAVAIVHPPPGFLASPGALEVRCEVSGVEGEAGGMALRVAVDGDHGGNFGISAGGPYTFSLPPLPAGLHSVQLHLVAGDDSLLGESLVEFTVAAAPEVDGPDAGGDAGAHEEAAAGVGEDAGGNQGGSGGPGGTGRGGSVSLAELSPERCQVLPGGDVTISVQVTLPDGHSGGGKLFLDVNGKAMEHPLESTSISIVGMPKGVHSVIFRAEDEGGGTLAQTKPLWFSTDGDQFSLDVATAREQNPYKSAALLAELYRCTVVHTSTVSARVWVLLSQAREYATALHYVRLVVANAPGEASFHAYLACALWLHAYAYGMEGEVACDAGTACSREVTDAFVRAMELGMKSVEAGGVINEMAGIEDPYTENDLGLALKAALLRAECVFNRKQSGTPVHTLPAGDPCLEDAWPYKCVVIYARQYLEELNEPWGPAKLAQGMGGANEAVIFMSRELARRGYVVRVYGNPAKEEIGIDAFGVEWRSFWEYDEGNRPGVFVVWWHHQDAVFMGRKARSRFMWFHYRQYTQRYTKQFMRRIEGAFAMSRYHAQQMPEYARNKTIVSGNGIDPAFFADGSNDPHTLIYASHPFYGLKTLLKAWPSIYSRIPEAHLEVYYGWTPGMIRHMERVGAQGLAFKEDVDRMLQSEGVVSKGMVGQRQLSEALSNSGFYVYPCEIAEISSISLMRAQAMGSIPITSRHMDSALNETAGFYDLGPPARRGLIGNDPEWVQEWADAIVDAVKKNTRYKDHRANMKKWAREKFRWERVGQQWHHIFQHGVGGGADIDDIVPLEDLGLGRDGDAPNWQQLPKMEL